MLDMVLKKIKRLSTGVVVILSVVITVAGCITKVEVTEKIRDLKFTVLEKAELPNELKEKISKNKEKAFHLTYSDQGEKPQSGYSVKVTEFYETAEAIYIHTELDGPPRDGKTKEIVTYPYIAVKTKEIGKPVQFHN